MIYEKRISVVITTYNGQKYIEEMLDSIRLQTVIPDEVLIYDDASCDETVRKIEGFISENKLDNWILFQNKENLGWRKNFYNAICAATGDYIFLADQDDRWDLNKIEYYIDALSREKNIQLLCSNFHVVSNNNAKVWPGKFPQIDDGTITRVKPTKNNLCLVRPGCTFCITKELKHFYNELADGSETYDLFLWDLALLNDGLAILNKKLLYYNRHEESVTNHKRLGLDERRKLLENDYLCIVRKISNSISKSSNNQNRIALARGCVDYCRARCRLLDKKTNILVSSLGLLKYIQYYPKISTYVYDIIVRIKGK
jgi:glycosyltransferase involved in cell wall biosynthesis